MGKSKYLWAVRRCPYNQHWSEGGQVMAILNSQQMAKNWIVQYGHGDFHYYVDKIVKEEE